jgi:hypothetical protein
MCLDLPSNLHLKNSFMYVYTWNGAFFMLCRERIMKLFIAGSFLFLLGNAKIYYVEYIYKVIQKIKRLKQKKWEISRTNETPPNATPQLQL